MDNRNELLELRSRVAELEAQNSELRTGKDRHGRSPRSIFSGIALVIAVLLAPLAVVSASTHQQLVNTERFVATFAPLADDPAFQSFLAGQVMGAIDEHIDIHTVVNDLFDGIGELDLSPRSQTALRLLRGPTADGLHSLVATTVDDVIASPTFAAVWETALRQSHSRAVAVLRDEPGTAITLSEDGTLAIQLGVIIERVRTELLARDISVAQAIPTTQRSVTLVTADSLALVRSGYQIAVTIGYWLPWLVLAVTAGGILLARNRLRALTMTSVGFALSLLVLAGGMNIGSHVAAAALSRSPLPTDAAQSLLNRLVELPLSSVSALLLLVATIAAGAWFAGTSRRARTLRSATNAAFGRARSALDRAGISTGGLGTVLDRTRSALIVIIPTIGALIVFTTRPVTVSTVLWSGFGILIAIVILELLRRPIVGHSVAGDTLPAEAK